MVPVWVIITVIVIAGFLLLLVFNNLRETGKNTQSIRRPVAKPAENTDRESAKPLPRKNPEKEPATPLPGKSPVSSRPSIEEATYVEASEGIIGGDFYAEVAELFLQTLAENPERQDLRLKLLDVYYDSGNKEGFLREAKIFQSSNQDKNDTDWQRICNMGRNLAPQEELFGGSAEVKVTSQTDQSNAEIQEEIRRFGDAEAARPALAQLAKDYLELRSTPQFLARLDLELLKNSGRPAPWLHAQRITNKIQGAQIFIKREDLNGGHPRLRTQLMGQAWIAKSLGKKSLVFAAANGEEAVIAARAAACVGLKCLIYISAQEGKYRESHKFQVQLMGSEFVETLPGDTSGDIRYTALDSWLSSSDSTFMLLNLQAGPHPYPTIANDLQAVIGRECIRQVKGKLGKNPKAIFARGVGNADAIGFVDPFLGIKETEIYLISPSESESNLHSSLASKGDMYQLLFTSKQKTSAAKMLDDMEYPRVDREHSLLKATGRIKYDTVKIEDAKLSIGRMAQTEGVIFPMNTACVLAYALEYARHQKPDEAVIILLAERLDKDLLMVGNDLY